MIAVALVLTPWSLGSLPGEDDALVGLGGFAELFSLQLFCISAGLSLAVGWARLRERHARAAGSATMAAAVVLNPWVLGYLVTQDRSVDDFGVFAAILFFQCFCMFGGFSVAVGWVRIDKGQGPELLTRVVAVGAVALSIAGVYWGLSLYNRGHSHTITVPSQFENVTPEQRRWADDFYERSLDAALQNGWFDFDTAMAQGFQKDRVNRTHFPHLGNMFDDVILDPERPEWLVYHDSPDGKVLMAFMFFTRELEDEGPTPAGPLALWHWHPYDKVRCAIGGIWTVGAADDDGKCTEGDPVTKTPEMFHVWFVDHPLGRYTEMKIVPEYWQNVGFDIRWIHPILVHFTIALFSIAIVLDVVGVLAKKPEYHFAAWLNLLLAGIFTLATVAAGMTAEVYARPTVQAHWVLETHKILAFSVLALLAILVPWRAALRGRFPRRGAILFMVLGILGVGLTAGAGYYGGEMVYKHGIAVRAIDNLARRQYWERVRAEYLPRTRAMAGDASGG